MTPTLLRRLSEEGIETIDDLRAAIRGESLDLQGVGDKTLLLWSERLGEGGEGTPIFDSALYASMLGRHIARHTNSDVQVTGSIRRFDELVDVVELLVVGGDDVPNFLARSALVQGAIGEGSRINLQTLGGDVVAHVAGPEEAGTALVETTGPADHIRALRTLTGTIDWPRTATEHDFYQGLGLELIPAPARAGEVPPAEALVDVRDVIGDLHLHSNWSPDGRQSLEDLVSQARFNGLRYIAVTDHAMNLRFGGLKEEDLRRQADVIQELRGSNPDLLIFHGSELNIGPDGALDYEDDLLQLLDFRLAAVHSHFDLDQAQQTDRMLTAIRNPLVHVVAHPTGRRIGRRPPLRLDFPTLVEAAVDARTALEVNGHLDRLDLGHRLVAAAASQGALFAADSDAHRPGEMANVGNAVAILQKARVDPSLIVNTWQPEQIRRWLESKTAG